MELWGSCKLYDFPNWAHAAFYFVCSRDLPSSSLFSFPISRIFSLSLVSILPAHALSFICCLVLPKCLCFSSSCVHSPAWPSHQFHHIEPSLFRSRCWPDACTLITCECSKLLSNWTSSHLSATLQNPLFFLHPESPRLKIHLFNKHFCALKMCQTQDTMVNKQLILVWGREEWRRETLKSVDKKLSDSDMIKSDWRGCFG